MKLLVRWVLALVLAFNGSGGSALRVAQDPPAQQSGAQAELSTAPASDIAARLAAIEKTTEEKRAELGVPGASLVIVKDDKVIFMKGFGFRDRERRLPVTVDTVFDTQSVTKPFTALAVMMAVDDGKLSLEDSPKKFLPYLEFRDPEIDAKVTLRDMLSHRTGLAGANLPWMTGALSRAELIRVIALAKPTARLREQFQYNNSMYSALGEVVAKTYNSTYERVIADRILKPLGMRASSLSLGELRKSPDFALGYEFTGVPGEVRRFPFFDYSTISAAGGLNSSARDMAQFLRLILGEGVIDGKRLLSEKSFQEMLTPQIKIGPTGYWALGWSSRGTWNGHRIIFHSGASEGFNSIIALMPDQKLGLALLTNISASPLARGAVEDAVWTHLVGKREPETGGGVSPGPATESQSTASFAAPFSVDELMARMIDAAGGEANLRKHKSVATTATLDYEQQGMTGEAVIHARAPNSWSRAITFFALGRELGKAHEFFGGVEGGAETSFLPPKVAAGDSFQDMKTGSDFYPLLNWKSLFKDVTIRGVAKVGDEDAYVIVKVPEKGTPVTDHVSTKSFLVLRRETTNGIVESYGDYRTVDGTVVPFRVERSVPGTGKIIVSVTSVRFDVAIPDSTFRVSGLLRNPGEL